MRRSLRFKIHELTLLKPFGTNGKYIGKNPFTKKKDDLIVDDYHDYIIINSNAFAGTYREFQDRYKTELVKLWEQGFNHRGRKIKQGFDLILQKKLFNLDNEIQELCREIKKIQKKFATLLVGSKNNKHYFDTEFDITIQFYVSHKHSAYNPEDDNIVYEDDYWNDQAIEGTKFELDRRSKDYFGSEGISAKYKKKDWSAITYYLYENCSQEDIMCIDTLFVEIKPMVQLFKKL